MKSNNNSAPLTLKPESALKGVNLTNLIKAFVKSQVNILRRNASRESGSSVWLDSLQYVYKKVDSKLHYWPMSGLDLIKNILKKKKMKPAKYQSCWQYLGQRFD